MCHIVRPCLPAFLLLFWILPFGACQVLPTEKTTSADAAHSLGTKKWELVELNGTPVATAPGSERPYLLFLPGEQRVAGLAGCNRIMGSYTIRADGSLSLGPLATTMMACPDMAAETAFLKALNEFGTTRQENGALLFLDDDGHTTVRLVATEPSDTAAD